MSSTDSSLSKARREMSEGAAAALRLAQAAAPGWLGKMAIRGAFALAALAGSFGLADRLGVASQPVFVVPAAVVEEAQESVMAISDNDPRRSDPIMSALFADFPAVPQGASRMALPSWRAEWIERAAQGALREQGIFKDTPQSLRKKERLEAALNALRAAQKSGAREWGVMELLAAAAHEFAWASALSPQADLLADQDPDLAAASEKTISFIVATTLLPIAMTLLLLAVCAQALAAKAVDGLRSLGRSRLHPGAPALKRRSIEKSS